MNIVSIFNSQNLKSILIAFFYFIIIMLLDNLNIYNNNSLLLFVQLMYIFFGLTLYFLPMFHNKVSCYSFIIMYIIYTIYSFIYLSNISIIIDIFLIFLPFLILLFLNNKINVFFVITIYFTALMLLFGLSNILLNLNLYQKTIEAVSYALMSIKGNDLGYINPYIDQINVDLVSFFAPTLLGITLLVFVYYNYKIAFFINKKYSVNKSFNRYQNIVINIIFILLAVCSVILNYKLVDKNLNMLYTTYNALFILSVFYCYLGIKFINRYIINLTNLELLRFFIFVLFIMFLFLFFIYAIILISVIGFCIAVINKEKYIKL